MMFRARLLRVGVVPPAGGEERVHFLRSRGKLERQKAAELQGEAIRAVEPFVGATFPYSPNPLAAPDLPDANRRREQWLALRDQLASRIDSDGGPLPGEEAARAALESGVDAWHDLNAIREGAEAHVEMHRYGEFVNGLFGCWPSWDAEQNLWLDTCPIALAHLPFGCSVGFTATYLCSVCRADITSCDHVGGVPYRVEVARYERDGVTKCSYCHESVCSHQTGQQLWALQRPLMHEPVMHETSLVASPREPRARICAMEMQPQPLPPNTPDDRVECFQCLLACGAGS